MKIFINTFLLIVLLPLAVNGQKRVPHEINSYKKLNSKFEQISLFKEILNTTNTDSKMIVKEATFAQLNSTALEKIINNQYQTIEILFPYKNEWIHIELYRVNLFSENFKINTDKQTDVAYSKGAYYRGIIKGDINSIASFNFFEHELNGIVSSEDHQNINIGKLRNDSNYIIYSDSDLIIQNEFVCNTKEDNKTTYNHLTNDRNSLTTKCVTTYFEIGYQAFQANGNNLTTTTNWITSIFNNSQTLFDNDGISINLKTIFIWTQDDYYSISSNVILPAFINIRPSFDGDIGFIADIDPSSLGGTAFHIGGLCTDRKYAYGDLILNFENIPTFSQPVYVLTHEWGHVLGSHHTHACVWNGNNSAIDGCAASYGGCNTPAYQPFGQGTIMSYCGTNLSLGFGEQPSNAIIQHINNSTCIGTDCISNCINTIGLIEVLNTTQTSATIQWADDNTENLQWNISVEPYGNAPNWNTTNTNSYPLINLIQNTYYEVIIAGSCTNGLSYPKHSKIFATQADNCAGSIIYDTGGLASGYSRNEHIIRTIVPTIPNNKIRLTFNNLNLEPGDFLFVYDGIDNNGPLLNYLTFGYPFLAYSSGNSFFPSGNTFESQDESGALTLEFFSLPFSFSSTQYSGWKATVSCVNSLSNNEFGDGFIDYTFGPNPVKDMLTIKSKDIIKEVRIFSVEGKLLSTKKTNDTNVNVDLLAYANASYVINLSFEKTEASFKIIKN